MILLILAGLIALIFGKMTITKGLCLKGRKARIYGALLIVLSIPYSFLTSMVLSFILPASILFNPFAKMAINILLLIAIIGGLAIPFREK